MMCVHALTFLTAKQGLTSTE